MIASPCIKVCEMDSVRGICIGCGRTLDEIARWGSMSDAEREALMGLLGARTSSSASRAATAERDHAVSACAAFAAPADAGWKPALPGEKP